MVSPGLTPGSAAGSGSRRLSQDDYHPGSDHYHTPNDNHNHDPANYNDNDIIDYDHNDYDAARHDRNDVATGDADFDNIIYHHGARDLNNYADIYHDHIDKWRSSAHPGEPCGENHLQSVP